MGLIMSVFVIVSAGFVLWVLCLSAGALALLVIYMILHLLYSIVSYIYNAVASFFKIKNFDTLRTKLLDIPDNDFDSRSDLAIKYSHLIISPKNVRDVLVMLGRREKSFNFAKAYIGGFHTDYNLGIKSVLDGYDDPSVGSDFLVLCINTNISWYYDVDQLFNDLKIYGNSDLINALAIKLSKLALSNRLEYPVTTLRTFIPSFVYMLSLHNILVLGYTLILNSEEILTVEVENIIVLLTEKIYKRITFFGDEGELQEEAPEVKHDDEQTNYRMIEKMANSLKLLKGGTSSKEELYIKTNITRILRPFYNLAMEKVDIGTIPATDMYQVRHSRTFEINSTFVKSVYTNNNNTTQTETILEVLR